MLRCASTTDAMYDSNNAGAFAVAHADVAVEYNYEQVIPYPEGEPNVKQCGMEKPLRYRCAMQPC